MIKKFILCITIISQLTSCKWFTRIGSPFYAMTDFKIPDGTPAFQQGFKDGCSNSTYARSNQFYRNKYGYKYDPKMIGNTEYRLGQTRGYAWCFQQSLSGVSGAVGSWDKYIHPYGYDATFSSGNIGDAWGGFFGGSGGSLAQTAGGDVGGFMGTLTNSGKSVMSGGAVFWEGGSSGQIFGQ